MQKNVVLYNQGVNKCSNSFVLFCFCFFCFFSNVAKLPKYAKKFVICKGVINMNKSSKIQSLKLASYFTCPIHE